MSRNRSSSPVSVSRRLARKNEPLSQVDGSCFGKPDASEHEPNEGADDVPAGQELPLFLRLSDKEVDDKYSELIRLEKERLKSTLYSQPDADPILDRYNNIQPWDQNRIRLQVPEGVSDYINASPVSLVSTSEKASTIKAGIQDKYICMQGPKMETIDHTWHMIWHELANPYQSDPAVIIMLTPLVGPDPNRPGQTMEKCSAYFPMDENSPPITINASNQLGESFKATVRFTSRTPTPEGTLVEIRQFTMTVDGEDGEKPIWHFLYPAWPDFGTLQEKNVASIISVMSLSREKSSKDNPRIVHCSAGVGRTGTFVALEFLIGELQGGAWEDWKGDQDPVYDTVNQLREQRPNMVQTSEQYMFLYEVLKKLWEEKYNLPCAGGNHQHGADNEDETQHVLSVGACS